MKVTICPVCRTSPEITNTRLSCPKCGRTAVGEYLEDTVTKWNNGEVTTGEVEEVPEVVEETTEVEPEVEEVVEPEIKPEPKPEPKKERKAPATKTARRTTKREGR